VRYSANARQKNPNPLPESAPEDRTALHACIGTHANIDTLDASGVSGNRCDIVNAVQEHMAGHTSEPTVHMQSPVDRAQSAGGHFHRVDSVAPSRRCRGIPSGVIFVERREAGTANAVDGGERLPTESQQLRMKPLRSISEISPCAGHSTGRAVRLQDLVKLLLLHTMCSDPVLPRINRSIHSGQSRINRKLHD
jgi:hypothetical protein